jgi:hypothetical protein
MGRIGIILLCFIYLFICLNVPLPKIGVADETVRGWPGLDLQRVMTCRSGGVRRKISRVAVIVASGEKRLRLDLICGVSVTGWPTSGRRYQTENGFLRVSANIM